MNQKNHRFYDFFWDKVLRDKSPRTGKSNTY